MSLAVSEYVTRVEDLEERVKELEIKCEELKKEVKDANERSLSETVNDLVQLNKAFKAIVLTFEKEMEEMHDEFTKCKTNIGGGVLAIAPRRMKVPKPKEFLGKTGAKNVDNFICGIEQYFKAIDIDDNATKACITSLYFFDMLFFGGNVRARIQSEIRKSISRCGSNFARSSNKILSKDTNVGVRSGSKDLLNVRKFVSMFGNFRSLYCKDPILGTRRPCLALWMGSSLRKGNGKPPSKKRKSSKDEDKKKD
ncbi:hypothetical protein PVK06_001561 [Gossypium arboreum]|uniref:Uncharacterized protein n=1 Tax=Gossypium arboreum TaxID=29729 RepID=A0ABR0R1C7_GOSAR|nr:hypothetical protein PVK06_001561 [Gossypium arboreum]